MKNKNFKPVAVKLHSHSYILFIFCLRTEVKMFYHTHTCREHTKFSSSTQIFVFLG